MELIVNGRLTTMADGVTVAGVLDALAIEQRGTAVAVNGDVAPRSQWSERALRDGDHVEVLTVAQGG